MEESAATPSSSDSIDQVCQPYVGRWNHLVSTTNWEKGQIIVQWRDALIEAVAPATEYSDEAWSRRVGHVTSQHVGRLRRVFQRFGQVHQQFEGLYWSHFQAAIDWDDAEMWLEGAVQNQWSVSQMRRTRWETLGSVGPAPSEDEVVAAELDEDSEAPPSPADQTVPQTFSEATAGPRHEGPDFGDEPTDSPAPASETEKADGAKIYAGDNPAETVPFVRPFETLDPLPDDLAEAFEAFKLAILRHKADDWQQISRDDLLANLDALKELAMAPSFDSTPM